MEDKKIKYERKLTEDERRHINEMSASNPMSAMRLANMLRKFSYRVGGKLKFFTPPNDESDIKEEISFKTKPLKQKHIKTSKCKGTLVWPGSKE